MGISEGGFEMNLRCFLLGHEYNFDKVLTSQTLKHIVKCWRCRRERWI